MMTSSNGNIFRVTGPLCGEFTGTGEFPTQRPVTRSFDTFFDPIYLQKPKPHQIYPMMPLTNLVMFKTDDLLSLSHWMRRDAWQNDNGYYPQCNHLSHGFECYDGIATRSCVALIFNVMEHTGWRQNKQGYSRRTYDYSIYKSVQLGVLEAV